MAAFTRRLDPKITDEIKKTALFELLLSDIKKGQVFPAIRNNRIDFYHGGGKLFSYDINGFTTHLKFASVLTGKQDRYVGESVFPLPSIRSFADPDAYLRIKENCRNYSGAEGTGVFRTTKHFAAAWSPEPGIIPLDIEICFATNQGTGKRKTDRIDVLFLNCYTQKMRFCEAKHFSNGEIWSEVRSSPRVVSQLERYRNQLQQRTASLVSVYSSYVADLNTLLPGLHLPPPTGVDEMPLFLLIFGFDRNQQDGRLENLLLGDGSLSGYNYYTIGSIESIKLENMWKGTKLGQACPPSPVAGNP